ncbi:TolC family protein, partial [Burkholderia contaminans]
MLPKPIVAAVLAALLSAGCAVGPDYVRPDVAMPQRFLGQRAVEQRHAAADAELATWWTGFGDPQLTRFVTIATAENHDVAQAVASVTTERAGLGVVNAGLLAVWTVRGESWTC